MSDLRVLDRPGATGNLLAKLPVPRSDVARTALPMSAEEMRQRGWDSADVVFVTGDAYIDHPSFAMAILGRILEAAGFRVGIVSQPDWQSADDWRRLVAGQTVRDLRDMRGVAFALGASETPPDDALTLPSFEEVRDDKQAFAAAPPRTCTR